MTRKITLIEKLNEVAVATAIHLTSREKLPLTAVQCMHELLQKVNEFTAKKIITVAELADSLKLWTKNGWAIIRGNALQITHAGRSHIKKLAKTAVIRSAPA